MAIHAVLSGRDLVVVCLYIPLNGVKDFLSTCNELAEHIYNNYRDCSLLILGDFNFPDMKWTKGVIKSGTNLKELHKSCFKGLYFMNCIG